MSSPTKVVAPNARRSGMARVFTGEPNHDGIGHDGYRGHITVDQLGVWVNGECEAVYRHTPPGKQDWQSVIEWEPLYAVEIELELIPWHRVYLIEWRDDVMGEA